MENENKNPMILACYDVSIRYITGDFKEIGIKEYVISQLVAPYFS